MATTKTSSDRFVRQQELVPLERVDKLLVTVIGIKAIDGQVVLRWRR